MKMTLWVSAILLFAASLGGLADAQEQKITQLCPAMITDVAPVHQTKNDEHNLGTDSAFGYYLYGDLPATVSGTLLIYGKGYAFRTAFKNVELKPHAIQNPDTLATPYRSARQYFVFNAPHPVEAVWVTNATSAGETSHGCTPVPDGTGERAAGRIANPDNAGYSQSVATSAVLDSKVDIGSCTTPFKYAALTEGIAPEYPQALKAIDTGIVVVLARVVLDEHGKVATAYIVAGQYPSANAATLRAVNFAKYEPAQLLCIPIAGTYQFRAVFDPKN